VLIANRGEVAGRVARACADLGMEAVAVYSADDAGSLHTRQAGQAVALDDVGPAAYLDAEQIVGAALDWGCDAVHPGYGFLSEDAGFARRCADHGLTFVGPSPEVLAQLGDKVAARALAASVGMPTPEGTGALAAPADAQRFLASLDGSPMILKAVAGGGGRGLRVVERPEQVSEAFERCRSEAAASFGDAALFAERYLPVVRHIEVQLLGDGADLIHLGSRDCSLQRRRQKLVEVAPAPNLHPAVRERLLAGALALGRSCQFRSLGTVELLVDAGSAATDPGAEFWFLECNPRLQVEHTVTEEVTGVDLVQTQLLVATGRTLAEQGLSQDRFAEPPTRRSLQLRVSAESVNAAGGVQPTSGTVRAFAPPTGPGVRVDTCAHNGFTTNPAFDPLLAKVVVSSAGDLPALLRRAARAMSELRIDGVETNAGLLLALVDREELATWAVDTGFLEAHLGELLAAVPAPEPEAAPASHAPRPTSAGPAEAPPGTEPITAPLQALVVSVTVQAGDAVQAGQEVAVLEAMKMHHSVAAPAAGVVRAVVAEVGDVLPEGAAVAFFEPGGSEGDLAATEEQVDLGRLRADLLELRERTAKTLDENRPDALAKRRAKGRRTARQNIADLCDDGSFLEYGQLAVAGQRRTRSLDDLVERTPADGLIAGIGTVNGEQFEPAVSRTAVLAYDYTVLAGTQGAFGHKKTDRVLEVARKWRLPVVFFTEGGGGRPGDSDFGDVSFSALDIATFATFAATSGSAPRIAVNAGYCFAGNALLFGCADVTIATEDSSIGLAGPVMIEGGGLGRYRPEEIGPIDVQVANGVVDLVAVDEAHGVRLAKQVLSYFQGDVGGWDCADQRALRHAVPEDRKRVYDMRSLVELLVDTGSFLELRRGYGAGMVTGLARIEGRPFGVFANDPRHLGGAIDAEAAEKTARFLQLCDAFDLPVLSLCDTPGFMVGPASERDAAVRRASSLAVVGANLAVPLFMVVPRKGYGLGAMAMGGGSFWEPLSTVTWPTGEFGGMGLEGAVQIIFQAELDAEPDPVARQALFDERVAQSYQRGKALSVARYLEIDAVIDPADTRRWLVGGLEAARSSRAGQPKRRPFIDTW